MRNVSLSAEFLPPPIPSDRFSYTGNAFRKVAAFRESTDGLLTRVSCELAFAVLTIASLVEGVVYAIFHLLSFCQFHLADKIKDAFLTNLFSSGMTTVNLFSSHPAALMKKAIGKIDPLVPHYVMMKFQFFPFDKKDKKWIQAKMLSHWLEMAGSLALDGEKHRLEGSFHNCMTHTMAHSIDAFAQSKDFHRVGLSKENAQKLSKAFHFSSRHPSPQEYVEKVAKKELCFLQSGWEGHAIVVGFFGNYMAIANRGDGSTQTGTLKVYKIDPRLISKSIITEIQEQTGRSSKEGIEYFSEELPRKLSNTETAIRDELCEKFDLIEPMYAPSGNCVLSSLEGVLAFGWVMLERNTSQEGLFRAELEPLFFRSWAALRYAVKLHGTFDEDEFRQHIVQAIRSKMKHLEDAEYYLKALKEGSFSESSFRRWRALNFAEALALNIFGGKSNPLRNLRDIFSKAKAPDLSKYDFQPLQSAV